MNATTETAAQCTPQQITAIYVKGKRLLDNEKHHDAAVMFRLMVYVAPSDERAWLGLGLCHEKQGQALIARELYVLGATAAQSARCFLACARLITKQGDHHAASVYFERAIASAHARGDETLVALATRERDICHAN
jgi:Tfp pilus assembly protein PilF